VLNECVWGCVYLATLLNHTTDELVGVEFSQSAAV